ncbi:unnamed protein product [Enterobius vermicularis]|uniref:Poly [ADP-ribose] polymerase n=1 Tax=Enterobius vermicularis TaxID=51028 RepID=A0A158Q994_ENTVE|nr:unnamed protein product [Enterobius vermicularis]
MGEEALLNEADAKSDSSEKENGNWNSEIEFGWEYELSKNKWVAFDKEVSKKLNSFPMGSDCAEIDLEGSKLRIDFQEMKQRNLTTGFVRPIRCVCVEVQGNYAWEYLDERERWRSFSPSSVAKLNEAFKNGSAASSVEISTVAFMADFENQTIINNSGSLKYKLRRELSKAAKAVAAKPVPSLERLKTLRKRKAAAVIKQETNSRNTSLFAFFFVIECEILEDRSEVRKVLVKGAAAVDPECLEKCNIAHVYMEGSSIYDVLLNQTNTQNNNNKYYIIQLLQDDIGKAYSVWLRWGRVGYKGQHDLILCGGDLEKAKSIFCRKFSDKTHNEWSQLKHFKKVAGKYDYIPSDYRTVNKDPSKKKDSASVPSKLDVRIQDLLSLICNLQLMEQNVMEFEYDSSKAPLGKLTKEQIKTGYSLLKDIARHVRKTDFSRKFVEAVNSYYTKIPHNFGMRQPPLIKTMEQLKNEMTLLEMLANIEISVRAIQEKSGDENLNPIDRHFLNMRCDLSVIASDDPQYKMINKYLQNTHAPTHSRYRMKIKQAFIVDRAGERDKFLKDLGNRKLLWHGSRITNWYGILSQGLRVAPPEAPSTGFMFGKGIYFADMSSKSANYCFPQKDKPGIMVLAEVALGNPRTLFRGDYDADKLDDGKNSTIGLGKIGPDPAKDEATNDGCVVPCGTPIPLKKNEEKNCALNYNEYVVYNTDQVRIRYALVLEFIFQQ